MPVENHKGQTIKVTTCVRLTADENGNLPPKLQVFPKGTYNTVPYGPMTFDDAVLQQFCDNYNASETRNEVPIDFDHEMSGLGGRAGGWVASLELGDDGLYAIPRWNKLGAEMVADEQYKYISPEWSFDYQDPQNGTFHGAVLIAASLVNKPLFRNMNESGVRLASEKGTFFAMDKDGKQINPLTKDVSVMLLFSQEKKIMNIADILKKPVADRTPEEVKALADSTELTEEQKAQVKTEADAAEKAKTDAEAAEAERVKKEKEEADAEQARKDKEAEDAKTANDKGNHNLTAAEYATFQANAKKLARMEAAETLNTYKANAKGGKLTPAVMPLALDFYLACEPAQQTKFVEFIKALPDQKMVAGEAGDSTANTHLTATEEIRKLSKELSASEKISLSQAQIKVMKDNPELVKAMKEEKAK